MPSRYAAIIEGIFFSHYEDGVNSFEFTREEIEQIAKSLNINLPKNLGDVVYSFRYRKALPQSIFDTASVGLEWVIEGVGQSKYRFRQAPVIEITPNKNLVTVKIPDATPELITAHAQSDEQALLAKVRYNRLIDIFLGITVYSLQSHLRTTVKDIGQIEIDEIYVGIDKFGRQFVIPVQAKGGSDRHGMIQTQQDIACCAEKFPTLICRAVSAQFMSDNKIALFELTVNDDGDVQIIEERHYYLVSFSEISASELATYAQWSRG